MADLGGKYLTFRLGKEQYGIGILKIREIVGKMPIVALPQAPDYIQGVVNLRGSVIPVLDLRRRFDMAPAKSSDKSCIIIVEASNPNMGKCWETKQCGKTACPAFESEDRRCWMLSGTHCRNEIQGSYHQKKEACCKCDFFLAAQKNNNLFLQGIAVDTVSEVANFNGDQIETPLSLGQRTNSGHILGLAKTDRTVSILLNIDRIVHHGDVDRQGMANA